MSQNKLISFGIPCYNSQDYMDKCINSILTCKDDVEIIIVDDGSKDNTASIADRYAEEYPETIKVIHQENGGHGAAVMAALRAATGIYYKVVDSDDWVDHDSLLTILDTIKKHQNDDVSVDLYITNFIYEHTYDNTSYRMEYLASIETDKVLTWDQVKPFKTNRALLMHSLLYRRQVLLDSKVELPKHTFYVDNIYAYSPLPSVKTLYYLNVDFYRYFIGRPDQSVTMANMFKRYEMQFKVMSNMLESHTYNEIKSLPKGLRKYMLHDLSIIFLVTVLFIVGGKSDVEVRKERYHQLWDDLKKRDKKMYHYLKNENYPIICKFLPWPVKRFAFTVGYKIAQKKLKLG